MAKSRCEFYLVIDENGDFQVNIDRDDALDSLAGAVRVVAVTILVRSPEDETVEVDIPDEKKSVEIAVFQNDEPFPQAQR
jgi:hypothetical protein